MGLRIGDSPDRRLPPPQKAPISLLSPCFIEKIGRLAPGAVVRQVHLRCRTAILSSDQQGHGKWLRRAQIESIVPWLGQGPTRAESRKGRRLTKPRDRDF